LLEKRCDEDTIDMEDMEDVAIGHLHRVVLCVNIERIYEKTNDLYLEAFDGNNSDHYGSS